MVINELRLNQNHRAIDFVVLDAAYAEFVTADQFETATRLQLMHDTGEFLRKRWKREILPFYVRNREPFGFHLGPQGRGREVTISDRSISGILCLSSKNSLS